MPWITTFFSTKALQKFVHAIIYSGFSLQFFGPSLNKTVRLWCFPYKYKKQGLIISGLLKFAERLGKEIEIDESESEILTINPDEPICSEFQNFYDKHRGNISKKTSK